MILLLFLQCCFLLIERETKRAVVDKYHFVLFLLFLLPRLSSTSVVFDFNASLNDVPPVSPTLLSVGL